MKQLVVAALLGLCALAHAKNPDINGYVGGGYGWRYAFPSQTAETTSSLGNRYIETSSDISSYGFGFFWIAPLGDPISLSLGVDYTGFSSEFQADRLSTPTGTEMERTNGSALEFSTGVRLYPAGFWHDYDPLTDHNPAGRLLWPSLFIKYSSTNLGEENKTVESSGYFNGFDGAYTYTAGHRRLNYLGQLPVASSLTLYAQYSKELNYNSSISGPLMTSVSDSGPGTTEGLGSGMIIYANDHAPKAANSPYLPHAGFPGRLSFDISYFQNYGLVAQRLLNRIYELGASYVFESGLGLNLTLAQVELGKGPFDRTGYTVTQTSTTGRSINFGIRYGWGKIRQPQPEDSLNLPPVPEEAVTPTPTPTAVSGPGTELNEKFRDDLKEKPLETKAKMKSLMRPQ